MTLKPDNPFLDRSRLWSSIPAQARSIFRSDGNDSRYWRNLLAFDPVATFTLSQADQLAALKSFLNRHKRRFCAGYFSYDLGLSLNGVRSRHEYGHPLAVFHAYENWAEMAGGKLILIGDKHKFDDLLQQPDTQIARDIQQPASLNFTPSVSKDQYSKSIRRIKDYIKAGDFYQLNYTQRLRSTTEARARDLYPVLLDRHPAEHACYFENEDLALHSLSPELFLHYSEGILSTEPIKGTRPRGKTEIEDKAFMQELLASEKEQAELFMISDLLRNDLGKVSEIGSVSLGQIKGLKKLPKVWHTYSRIYGKLLSGLAPLDALISMLPGGSISGCPKKRALEVIDELEESSRGIYTGCLGYVHPDGDFSFNIAIRTLVQQGEDLSLGTGGGITIDSNWEDEWEELLVKASTFI